MILNIHLPGHRLVFRGSSFLMLFFNAPLGLLMIMVFIFPFSGTEAFRAALADIPGFKPLAALIAGAHGGGPD
jgi:hypothetical protein